MAAISCATSKEPHWGHFVSPFCYQLHGSQTLDNHTEWEDFGWRWKRNKFDCTAFNAPLTPNKRVSSVAIDERGLELGVAMCERNIIDEILQKVHEEPHRKQLPQQKYQAVDIVWSPEKQPLTDAETEVSKNEQNDQKSVSAPNEQHPLPETRRKRKSRHRFVPPLLCDLIGTFYDELVPEEQHFGPICLWRERNEFKRVLTEQRHAPKAARESQQRNELTTTLASLAKDQKQVGETSNELQGEKGALVEKLNQVSDILWNPESQRGLGTEIACSVNKDPVVLVEFVGAICRPCNEPERTTSPQKRERQVRFGTPIVHKYKEWEVSESDNLDLWWQRSEFKTIMSENLCTASKMRQQTIVADGFDRALQVAQTMASLLGDGSKLDELLEKMEDEHRGLQLWCQYGHARRGLERFTSRQYYCMRRKEMIKLTKRIVELSEQGADPELIRQVSKSSSCAFAILARMFGIADCKAAKSKPHDESEWGTFVGESNTAPEKKRVLYSKRFSI